ncbi:MAG: mandelate racemase, partial [Chloroflexi bacterium]|nr:mandelate racemase [Chloroflexota bacterium]
MNQGPKITAVEITSFEFHLNQMGRDHNGFNLVFEPGGKLRQEGSILQ